MKENFNQIVRFCMVGTVGFLIDAGCTLMLSQTFTVPPGPSRLLAFLVAASATWALNRHFTFRVGSRVGTWLLYVLSTSFGALINISAYLLWLGLAGNSAKQIVAGIAIGSVCALAFNYTISRYVIFRA